MDHGVHYRTRDGATTFEPVSSLDAAVSLVERLRNDEGVSDIRVYRQVPIEFKAYYKVSVVEDGARADASAGSSSAGGPSAGAPTAQPSATPRADIGTPPPGAMPLSPTPQPSATPSAQPAAAAGDDTDDDEVEPNRRGSLFSRG